VNNSHIGENPLHTLSTLGILAMVGEKSCNGCAFPVPDFCPTNQLALGDNSITMTTQPQSTFVDTVGSRSASQIEVLVTLSVFLNLVNASFVCSTPRV
jgi:hypothetical protein